MSLFRLESSYFPCVILMKLLQPSTWFVKKPRIPWYYQSPIKGLWYYLAKEIKVSTPSTRCTHTHVPGLATIPLGTQQSAFLYISAFLRKSGVNKRFKAAPWAEYIGRMSCQGSSVFCMGGVEIGFWHLPALSSSVLYFPLNFYGGSSFGLPRNCSKLL